MKPAGIYVSPTEFRSFADQQQPLTTEIATRLAAGDLSGYFGSLPNPDPVLKAMGRDQVVYQSLLVDPLIKGIRRRRMAAVLAMERGYEQDASNTPARVRKACEAAVASYLDIQALVRTMLDGAFFGYRVLENLWSYRDGLQVPVPVGKPGRWFGFDPDTAALKFRPLSSLAGIAVPDHKFLVVGKMRSWENPYGEPDLAPCFWPVVFKRGGMKFWVTFTEKYGMPWAVGKQPRSSSQAETDSLADKLAAMVRDAVAVVPDDSSVELIQAAGTANADLYEKLLMFCRSEISIALLGNNQSVELQANRASAAAAQEIEEDLQDDDAQMVAEGVNQWTADFCAVNFPGAEPPVWKFWRQTQVDDTRAKRDQVLHNAGARLTPEYFKRAYNLEDGDLDIAAMKSAAEQAGGGAAVDDGTGTESFADPELPAEQAALDAAIDQLPADAINSAMRKLLAPALAAIKEVQTPDEVRQALADAWPEMDASDLQELMTRAYFVADLVGRDSVRAEAT